MKYLWAASLLFTTAVSAQVTFQIHGTGHIHRAATVYDSDGNLYVSGLFSHTIDFDPGPESHTLTATYGESAFLASYNSQGLFRWVRGIEPVELNFPPEAVDNADLEIYDDGWQDDDNAPGFGNWFTITELLLGSGYRALHSDTPLEGTRSWQLSAPGQFSGVGRTLAGAPMTEGKISVLIRHDVEPDGKFVGFNLHGVPFSLYTFGGTGERVSFGMNTTNLIGVTVNSLFTPDFYLEPTIDGDLRGDLLEYIIDIRSNGLWTLQIINHSEPGSPSVTTNVQLASASSSVGSIRFASFVAGTNNILVFDRIQVTTGQVDSVIETTGISFVEPANIWVHGGFSGSIKYGDSETNTLLGFIRDINGFAVGYDLAGNLAGHFQPISTSAPGKSVISGVTRFQGTNMHYYGHFSGSLTVSNLTISSGEHQQTWRAILSPSGDPMLFFRYNGVGTQTSIGKHSLDSGHVVMLGHFTGNAMPGLSSIGGSDIMMLNADSGAFQFGGPGDDTICRDCLVSDAEGTLYFGGNFQQTIAFDRYEQDEPCVTTDTISANGFSDMFIASFNGEILYWARSFGGAETNTLYSLGLDRQTNLIVAGAFRGTMEMDGMDEGSFLLTSYATGDALDGFVASYDSRGSFRWAHRIGPEQAHEDHHVIATSVSVDSSGHILVAGSYATNLHTDIRGVTLVATNAGASDLFLIQFDSNGELAGPGISIDHVEETHTGLSIATRAGVAIRVESSDFDTSWTVVTNIPLTTGTVAITTSDASPIYRAVIDW